MNRFDMRAFHAELDAQRRARGLSWTKLAAEINRPFESTPSMPINPATLRDMLKSDQSPAPLCSRYSDGWGVRRRVFFRVPRVMPAPTSSCLRQSWIASFVSIRARFSMLFKRNGLRRGLTWQQVAHELPGFTPSMFTNLASGPLIRFPRVMTLTQWLNRPAAAFVRARSR